MKIFREYRYKIEAFILSVLVLYFTLLPIFANIYVSLIIPLIAILIIVIGLKVFEGIDLNPFSYSDDIKNLSIKNVFITILSIVGITICEISIHLLSLHLIGGINGNPQRNSLTLILAGISISFALSIRDTALNQLLILGSLKKLFSFLQPRKKATSVALIFMPLISI